MQTGLATPALQGLNWIAVFARFMQTMGIRNLQDYVAPQQPNPQMQVMGDEQLQNQVQQGNLVPAGGSPGSPSQNIEPTMTSDQFPMQPNTLSTNGSQTGY
jgi:hypothetical protein